MIHKEKFGGGGRGINFLTDTKRHTEKATSLLLDVVVFHISMQTEGY